MKRYEENDDVYGNPVMSESSTGDWVKHADVVQLAKDVLPIVDHYLHDCETAEGGAILSRLQSIVESA